MLATVNVVYSRLVTNGRGRQHAKETTLPLELHPLSGNACHVSDDRVSHEHLVLTHDAHGLPARRGGYFVLPVLFCFGFFGVFAFLSTGWSSEMPGRLCMTVAPAWSPIAWGRRRSRR